MTALASGLYRGVVTHARTRPRRHHLSYHVYMMLFDLDELPTLATRFRLFAVNRFALLAFHERDHGDGTTPLQTWVRTRLATAGISAPGPIRVLCYPRVLGGVFNPISTFFCHHTDGNLAAILYEVNNTFGQRHHYLIAAHDPQARPIRQHCAKALYVSPFMTMDMAYDFAVRPPDHSVSVTVRGRDAQGTLITANFTAERQELSNQTLLTTFLQHPLLALKILASIHWQALRLLAKGIRLTERPRLG